MKFLDKPCHAPDHPEPQPAEELSDAGLEAIAAGANKQPSSGVSSRGRNFRPPLLTGFSPNVP